MSLRKKLALNLTTMGIVFLFATLSSFTITCDADITTTTIPTLPIVTTTSMACPNPGFGGSPCLNVGVTSTPYNFQGTDSIASVRAASDGAVNMTIEGIITNVFNSGGYKSGFIQDQTGGIFFFRCADPGAIGTRINVTISDLSTYFSQKEINCNSGANEWTINSTVSVGNQIYVKDATSPGPSDIGQVIRTCSTINGSIITNCGGSGGPECWPTAEGYHIQTFNTSVTPGSHTVVGIFDNNSTLSGATYLQIMQFDQCIN